MSVNSGSVLADVRTSSDGTPATRPATDKSPLLQTAHHHSTSDDTADVSVTIRAGATPPPQAKERLNTSSDSASDDAGDEQPSGSSASPPVAAQRKQSLFDAADDAHREEFLQVTRMDGYVDCWWRPIRYWLACILSAGVVWLLNLWFFASVVPWRYRRVSLEEATHVLVVGRVHGAELLPVQELGADVAPTPSSMQSGAGSDLLSVTRGRMITFRHMRFIFSPASGLFIMQQADVVNKRAESRGAEHRHQSVANLTSREIQQRMGTGLQSDQVTDNRVVYGINALILPVPSIPTLLYQEVFHPFYVFQMYSVILWGFEAYYIFAGAIAVIAIVSIIQTLVETRRRMTELAELARFDCSVSVLRGGSFTTISSTDLVPGDIVQVATGLLPCDLVLLDGGAVVNESMLTGESVPVVKTNVQFPVDRMSETVVPLGGDARNTLFSATKILQLKPARPDSPVLAAVVRTGFATTKGSLILSILYPQPSEFKFVAQSYKFVAALFTISLVGFGVSVWQLDAVQGATIKTILIRGLDLITIVVPPSLPLALTVGVNFALVWLRKEYIFCISPSRISMAGKIRCFCFDKTGTLTAESLEFMGVLPAASVTPRAGQAASFGTFQSPHTQRPQLQIEDAGAMFSMVRDPPRQASASVVDTTHSVPLSPALKLAMACCQSLANMDGELIGDPLEQQTFEASNATLQDTGDLQGFQQIIRVALSTEESVIFGVVHQFEFSSALQRQSVLCTETTAASGQPQHWAFVKGSPEMMETLCVPESLPSDYHANLAYFARQGYRVIAIGRKVVDAIPRMEKNELRDFTECKLNFLGLILLENKLKPESEPTLEILRDAAVRCVMITGDHPSTGVTVAKECHLVAPGTRIFQSTLVGDAKADGSQSIEWIDTDDSRIKLDPLSLRLPPQVLADARAQADGEVPYELAVTGPVFKLLQDRHLAEKADGFSGPDTAYYHRVMLNGQVFARMSPDQKASLVSELQHLGIYTGMVGDGANDCSALKTAHVGISLSESEASIAAPFTYARPNVSCIPILLSEGRSSLITSFQLFRYMAMYSMTQFGAVILTYFQGSVLGNWQYLYQDLWLVFPLTILMGSTRANRLLSIKCPSGDLLSVVNLVNLAVHIALGMAFQVLVYETIIHESEFVVLPNPDNTPHSYVSTALYYFSNFQYTIIACLFALGQPWKASILTNRLFSFWAVVSLGASTALLYSPAMQPRFFRHDDLVIPMSWKNRIALYALLFLVSACVWELILHPLFVRAWKRWQKSGGTRGQVFARTKLIDGPRSKPYHRLRGEFEAGWRAHVY